MAVVDASIWVASLVKDDIHYEATRSWLEAHIKKGGPCVAPALVLPEVSGAIARRTGRSSLGLLATETIKRVPGFRLVPIGPDLADLARNLAAVHMLRGADACYAALAHRLDLPLVSWDQEQLKTTSGILKTGSPADLL